MDKKSGSGMKIYYHISYILKCYVANSDPGPFGPGSRIRDKHPGSATLPSFEKHIPAIMEGRTVSLTVDVMHKYTVHCVPVMFSPRVLR